MLQGTLGSKKVGQFGTDGGVVKVMWHHMFQMFFIIGLHMKPEIDSDVYLSVVKDVFCILTEDITSVIVGLIMLHGMLKLNELSSCWKFNLGLIFHISPRVNIPMLLYFIIFTTAST